MSTAKKKHTHKERPAIRIGAGSGARSALKAVGNHGSIDPSKDLADEEGGDGLPNKRAYMLLKQIYEEVGEPFHGEGLSWYDKVHAIKIDNASNLLYTTTWHDFFEKRMGGKGVGTGKRKPPPAPTPAPAPAPAPAPVPAPMGKKKTAATRRPPTISRSNVNQQVEVAFEHMVQRVNLMWMELKMDKKERDFYAHALMRGPCEHLSQCHALAQYLVVLQDYRLATIDVLEAIEGREEVLRRMYGVVAAIQSYRATELGGSEGLSGSHTPLRGGIRSLRPHATAHASPSANAKSKPGPLSFDSTPQRDGNKSVGSPFSPHRASQIAGILREDLAVALKELQIRSADVVRAVQRWRSHLWRPLPFRWKGLDYIGKMAEDTLVLGAGGEGAWLGQFIDSIPLCREDLMGILFERAEGLEGYVSSIRAEAQLSDLDMESPLRKWFLEAGEANREEQLATVAVVHEHTHLVEALEREKRRLEHEGVFIPVLKVAFDAPAGELVSPSGPHKDEPASHEKETHAHRHVVHHHDDDERERKEQASHELDTHVHRHIVHHHDDDEREHKEHRKVIHHCNVKEGAACDTESKGIKGASEESKPERVDEEDEEDAFMSSHGYDGHDLGNAGVHEDHLEKINDGKEVSESDDEEAVSPPRPESMAAIHMSRKEAMDSIKMALRSCSPRESAGSSSAKSSVKESRAEEEEEEEEEEGYERDVFEPAPALAGTGGGNSRGENYEDEPFD